MTTSHKTPQRTLSLYVFLLLSVLHLTAQGLQMSGLIWLTKPLLMPILAWYYFQQMQFSPKAMMVVLALLLSFAGDTLLLFALESPAFFMAGLVAFLLAHLTYIVINLRSITLSWHWLDIAFVAYGIGFFLLIADHLGALFYPTMAYTAVICMMIISARQRLGQCQPLSFWLVLCGAALFVISDSLLAFNKFVVELPYSSILIMLTYLTAQLLIVKGYLANQTGS